MGRSHNKKRNIGIIFEQLVRYISLALVNKDNDKAIAATNIIKEHFKPGTELYREFRLFNALVKTRVLSESLANRILSDAKEASRKFNSQDLRHQKSSLIKDINHKLNDSEFYLQRIDEYRDYATIQTLLNDWRAGDKGDISRIAKYEDNVCRRLLSENKVTSNPALKKDDVDSLTVKILTEKFNKKYGNSLNTEQQELIREYVFSLGSSNNSGFTSGLSAMKKNTLHELRQFSKNCTNQVLNEKISEVIRRVDSIYLNEINDDLISKLLVVSKLKEELLEMSNE